MEAGATNHSKPLFLLSNAVEKFIQEVNKQKLKNLATEAWTVKDVLCHIVFWHQYYAKQYKALATGKRPSIFTSKGGSTRNQKGVDSLKHISKKNLVKMLNKAQASLYTSIMISHVQEMDYTDKKQLTTKDFLEEAGGHIKRHTAQVRKARESAGKVRKGLF